MTTIARKYVAALLMCIAVFISATAQKDKSSFQMHGNTFPYITIEQLIRYCDMDSASFDSVMRSMDFVLEENIYTKGTLDESKMVFGKSTNFGTSIVWISNDSSVSIIERMLEKFTHPSNISLSDGFSFMYKKYVISVKSTQATPKYEEINIIDKINYNKNQDN
ncbi:MAG: hypothetical protein IKQ94_10570 [Bacteroidales bacterium]|nr:hypothetical protein [Bacteroidales bacterium]